VDLIAALRQAEGDIKELKAELEGLREERDRFYEESRWSARQLGAVIRVLRDGGVELGDTPEPGASGRAPRPRGASGGKGHGFRASTVLGGAVCWCGAQWLTAADRCVTEA
jgi:hypothetical protein